MKKKKKGWPRLRRSLRAATFSRSCFEEWSWPFPVVADGEAVELVAVDGDRETEADAVLGALDGVGSGGLRHLLRIGDACLRHDGLGDGLGVLAVVSGNDDAPREQVWSTLVTWVSPSMATAVQSWGTSMVKRWKSGPNSCTAAEAMEAKQRQAAKSRNAASLLKTCSSWLGRFDAEAVEAARYVVWGANRATVLCTSTV